MIKLRVNSDLEILMATQEGGTGNGREGTEPLSPPVSPFLFEVNHVS